MHIIKRILNYISIIWEVIFGILHPTTPTKLYIACGSQRKEVSIRGGMRASVIRRVVADLFDVKHFDLVCGGKLVDNNTTIDRLLQNKNTVFVVQKVRNFAFEVGIDLD